jgi:alpha-tubulin suppressor-like RCC1 family protein
MADVVSVDAAITHTLYALSDGTVWTLGENKWASTSVPVQVTGIANVLQVATLSAGGIMLRNDGSVWGFGDDRNAQCALAGQPNPGTGAVIGPIPIPGLPANITSISSGNQHTIALDVEGNAWVWGSRFGCTPWIALDNVVAVAAGDTDLCLFARADGSAWAMGFNLHGQLGNGTTASNYTTATQVLGLTDVVAVAAGDRHSMFLLADGSLWTSGWNNDCRLGLETEVNPATPLFGTNVLTPAQVPLADVVTMAGGYAHGVAVTADDAIWVWGLNNAGQLSDGTNELLPVRMCTPTPVTLPAP